VTLETKFIPAEQRGSLRLMIVLHGLGDSMAGYGWVPQMFRLPWLNYMLVNAPDPYYGGYSWYDLYGDAASGVKRSTELLRALLDAQRDSGFPTEQTILSGFSQGCLMTLETGLRYAAKFAALVGISGYVLDADQLLRDAAPVAKQQRVLVTHGRQDPMIPCEKAAGQMQQLRAGGIPIEWREFDKPHTIVDEEIALIRDFIVKSFPS
jgi:phospholipase/carboxylesterase